MPKDFSLRKQKGSFRWIFQWPLIGTALSIGYAVMRVQDFWEGTDEQLLGVLISIFFAATLLIVTIWELIHYLRTGKNLVTFTDTHIIFPREKIPVQRVQKVSVSPQQITVTKKNNRVISLDLSLFTPGISKDEENAIASWAAAHGIAKFYGVQDKDAEMADIKAELAAEEKKLPRPASHSNSSDEESKTGWKTWAIVIWAGLSLIGFIIAMVNIPDQIRIGYLFRIKQTQALQSFSNIQPGAQVKVSGIVTTEDAFPAVWDHRPAVYEHQIKYSRYGRSTTETTVVHRVIPFDIQTDNGERVKVVPSIEPLNHDRFEAAVIGESRSYTDWSIRAGDRITVYGPIQNTSDGPTLKGVFGKRLFITNLPEAKLKPFHRPEFWVYLIAWLCFGSGAAALGIAILRHSSKN